jgi:excisionase family DNA binding protein
MTGQRIRTALNPADRESQGPARTMTDVLQALTPRQAARYLGVSDATLRLWRSGGKGPKYFRAGEKLVRYRRADLDAWIEARLCTPTV